MRLPEAPPGYPIGQPSLSPDGDTVAFVYGRAFLGNELLLFDIPTATLRSIETPPRFIVSNPTFSPDARRLAMVTYCLDACEPGELGRQIATIDLESEDYRIVTSGRHVKRYHPVLSPDGRTVYFSSGKLVWKKDYIAEGREWFAGSREVEDVGFDGVSKVDLGSGEESLVLPNSRVETRFLGVFVGSVTNDGAIVMTTIAPHGGEFEELVDDLWKEYKLVGAVYDQGSDLVPLPLNATQGMSSLSASADGKRLVFISSPPDDRYNYDLFQLVDGEVSQLTTLKTFMARARISANGKRVVFLADSSSRQNWTIWIHDIETGETRPILTPEAILTFVDPNVEMDALGAEHDESGQ